MIWRFANLCRTTNKVWTVHCSGMKRQPNICSLPHGGNSGWSAEEEVEAKMYLNSELLPANDLCLLHGSHSAQFNGMFLTAQILMVTGRCYTCRHTSQPARFSSYCHCVAYTLQPSVAIPELETRLSLLNEDGSFGKQLNRIYIQLLRSQETEKIDKKMREEIIRR